MSITAKITKAPPPPPPPPPVEDKVTIEMSRSEAVILKELLGDVELLAGKKADDVVYSIFRSLGAVGVRSCFGTHFERSPAGGIRIKASAP